MEMIAQIGTDQFILGLDFPYKKNMGRQLKTRIGSG